MDKVGVGKCNSFLLKSWGWEIESVLWWYIIITTRWRLCAAKLNHHLCFFVCGSRMQIV